MATKIQPDIKVFYINTGCEFRETDESKTIIKNRHHLNLAEYASKLTVEEQGRAYGEELFQEGPGPLLPAEENRTHQESPFRP